MSTDNINIELTQEQFNHVKTILAQSKPSRTRLTTEEKEQIIYLCKWWMGNFSEVDEDDIKIMKSIIKKLD